MFWTNFYVIKFSGPPYLSYAPLDTLLIGYHISGNKNFDILGKKLSHQIFRLGGELPNNSSSPNFSSFLTFFHLFHFSNLLQLDVVCSFVCVAGGGFPPREGVAVGRPQGRIVL